MEDQDTDEGPEGQEKDKDDGKQEEVKDKNEGGKDGKDEDKNKDKNDDENGLNEEDDEESDNDLDLMFKADSEEKSYNSELVQAVHDFVRSIVYSCAWMDITLHHTPSKQNDPIEQFIAVYSLQPDGNFRQAWLVIQVFVMFHYHIWDAILYEDYLRLGKFEGNIYKYASQFAIITHNFLWHAY